MTSTSVDMEALKDLYDGDASRVKARALLHQDSDCFPLLALLEGLQKMVFKEMFRGGLLQISQRKLLP